MVYRDPASPGSELSERSACAISGACKRQKCCLSSPNVGAECVATTNQSEGVHVLRQACHAMEVPAVRDAYVRGPLPKGY